MGPVPMSRPCTQAALVGVLLSLLLASVGSADDGSAGIFVRNDTDGTTVISPRASAATTWDDDESRLEAVYSADIWTSASIDVRTAATVPVSEQRDQIDLSGFTTFEDVMVGGSTYFSGENDYLALGASMWSMQELAGGSATVEERVSFGYDVAGRSGDPHFAERMGTIGGRLVLTQALDPSTIVQGAWEVSHREGYQSNPYRFVGMGGDGQCAGSAALCLPEAHPRLRTRHAFVVRGRRSLSADSSVGVGYRFYLDDWGIMSHTGVAQVAWLPGEASTVTLRYRFYLQEGADFYRARYPMPTGEVRFVTRDRELSPMFSNRVALAYENEISLADDGPNLRWALAIGGTVFVYRDFVGLTDTYAVDATAALTLEL